MKVLTNITNEGLVNSVRRGLKEKSSVIVEIHGTPEEADTLTNSLELKCYKVFREEHPIPGIPGDSERYYFFEVSV